jgi:2-methylcitrate dehydratase PrpD
MAIGHGNSAIEDAPSGEEPVAAQFARYVASLAFDDLPAHVIGAAKRLIRDQLACQLIGSTLPWVSPALQLVELSAGLTGESTVVNHPVKYLAADAAFINATYGQACELDDSTFGSAGHIGTATIPVVIAAGEREHIDGRTLITAVVAGYEIMFRLMASVRPYHNARGFHSQSIAGPFAGAAAVGKIFGLGSSQLTHALAVAGSHACGPLEFDQGGGEVKRIHAGIAARAGIHSAQLAKFGLTGPPTIIEGRRGFCRLFSTQCDLSQLTTGLGDTFNITNVWFKVYPATGPVHTAIGATAKLVEDHRIRPADVARIRVALAETSLMHGGGIHIPQDVIGDQFSLAFSVALAIVKRRNALSDYMDSALWSDPEIVSMMNKVEMIPDLDARGKKHHMATVRIELNDGRALTTTEAHPVGTPPNPASERQLREKAEGLARAVLSEACAERLMATIDELETLSDIGALAAQLSGG